MAGKLLYDTEEKRYIDRIRAVAFREARDAGARFINKKWIAKRLNRSREFVKHNWCKSYGECKTTFGGGRPQKLSEESVALVKELSQGKGREKKSSVLIAKELEVRTNEKISRTTVMRYQKKINSKETAVQKGSKVKAPRKSRSKKTMSESMTGAPDPEEKIQEDMENNDIDIDLDLVTTGEPEIIVPEVMESDDNEVTSVLVDPTTQNGTVTLSLSNDEQPVPILLIQNQSSDSYDLSCPQKVEENQTMTITFDPQEVQIPQHLVFNV